MLRNAVRRLVRATVAVGAALTVAAVSTPLRAEDPYDVEVILSLTGPLAFAGKDEADALSVLERVTNKAGGVRGPADSFRRARRSEQSGRRAANRKRTHRQERAAHSWPGRRGNVQFDCAGARERPGAVLLCADGSSARGIVHVLIVDLIQRYHQYGCSLHALARLDQDRTRGHDQRGRARW